MHRDPIIRRIPLGALAAPIRGSNLDGKTLAEELGDTRTLLVFLRHFGSSFCGLTVEELRDQTENDPHFPPTLFVHQGSEEMGQRFFARYWPEARALADPERHFYRAFGVRRASFGELFAPGVWASTLRAVSRGHRPGFPVGDLWLMPGLFLVERDAVLWRHRFRNAGDQPDFADLPLIAVALS